MFSFRLKVDLLNEAKNKFPGNRLAYPALYPVKFYGRNYPSLRKGIKCCSVSNSLTINHFGSRGLSN